jgi:hypothetical protein
MVIGVIFICGSFEFFVGVYDKTASNGKRIGRTQIESMWKKELVVLVAIFESP